MTIRAVLFDLGGTLLFYSDPVDGHLDQPFRRVTFWGVFEALKHMPQDKHDLHLDEIAETVDAQIREAQRQRVAGQAGGSVEVPVRAALAELGYPLDDAQWAGVRPAFYSKIVPKSTVREGAKSTLETLRDAGLSLGLAVNTWWPAEFHDSRLDEFGLLGLLPARLYSCDQPYSKPHPAFFTAALKLVKAEPSEAIFVGDQPAVDIQGAQAVGMRAVLVQSPYEETPLNGAAPDAVIDELPELLDVITGWG